MSRPPEGADRQERAARLRNHGIGFAHIARHCGYDSPEEAEAEYNAFMESRKFEPPQPST